MVRSRDFDKKAEIAAGAVSLALVGAGALGSEIGRLLLNEGFARVLVVDPDELCGRNLPLSRLYREAVLRGEAGRGEAGLGEAKAGVLVRLAAAAGLDWTARAVEIADLGLGELAGTKLMISATDSVLARAETAFAARTLRLPMIDAGVHGDGVAEGRVTWFPGQLEAACTLCGLSEGRRAELLAYAHARSLGCAAPPEFPQMSGAQTIVERVAAMVLRLIKQPPAMPTAFAVRVHAEDQQNERVELTRSEACPWHELPEPGCLMAMAAHETAAEVLARAPGLNVLDLPWPLCVRAGCRACGAAAEPYRRTAYVRRRMGCGRCGQVGTLDPEVQLGSIAAGDPAAKKTARQLGLPDRHLYSGHTALFC